MNFKGKIDQVVKRMEVQNVQKRAKSTSTKQSIASIHYS